MAKKGRDFPLPTLRIVCQWACIFIAVASLACGQEPAPMPTPAPPTPSAPPTATAAPASAGYGPTGTKPPVRDVAVVIMAVREVGPVIGDPATGPYRTSIRGEFGIGDYLFMQQDGDPMAPMLASAWEISPDGSTVSIRVREGIPFNTPPVTQNMDYGELTADDVVWMLNRHNLALNPRSSAGDANQFAAFFEEANTTGEYSLEIPLAKPVFFGLPLTEMGIHRAVPAVESRRAFDLLGPDRIQDISVGTGPFVQRQWTPGELGVVEAVPDNWLKTAKIETFRVVQTPASETRIAMLASDLADAAEIDLSDVPNARLKGLEFIPTMRPNDTVTVSVVFVGNLWEEFHGRTGEPLEPWNSPAYERDYAWIGNPWGDKSQYTDTDNPDGMSDMEQARLVRWALSMAIDRDHVVEEIQAGLGTPLYIEYIGPLYPGWDPDRKVVKSKIDAILEKHGCADCPTHDVWSPTPGREWPWRIPLDRVTSEELLDIAGYPRGEDGTRFEIKIVKNPCETGDLCLDQANAVADAWEEIGVGVTLLREQMFPIVSGRMTMREQFWPLVINCIVETANTPLDWPFPPHDTSLTRPGWGCGFESEFLAKMQLKITSERDRGLRESWHLDVADWMYYWQLFNGIAQQPKGVVVNPDRIESWSARSSMLPVWHRPEFIVPAR
ncbi:MAG: hypothetical protein F4X94_01910 [Dehalococcoidia bacterium]|nr:hypothetical protein [Dehalococcoidia bacterium]